MEIADGTSRREGTAEIRRQEDLAAEARRRAAIHLQKAGSITPTFLSILRASPKAAESSAPSAPPILVKGHGPSAGPALDRWMPLVRMLFETLRKADAAMTARPESARAAGAAAHRGGQTVAADRREEGRPTVIVDGAGHRGGDSILEVDALTAPGAPTGARQALARSRREGRRDAGARDAQAADAASGNETNAATACPSGRAVEARGEFGVMPAERGCIFRAARVAEIVAFARLERTSAETAVLEVRDNTLFPGGLRVAVTALGGRRVRLSVSARGPWIDCLRVRRLAKLLESEGIEVEACGPGPAVPPEADW